MNLKKKFGCLILCALAFSGLAGCDLQTSRALVFDVETGEKVKVKLDTTDHHSLSHEDNVFIVKKDDKVMLQGVFLSQELFDSRLSNIAASKEVTIIENKLNEDHGYLYYKVTSDNQTEYDRIFMIQDAKTGILMGSFQSQKEAEAAFDKVQVTLDED